MLQYHQELSKSFFLIRLASAFHSIGDKRDATSLENIIEESLTLQTNIFRNIIDFANDIMKNKFSNKVEQHLICNLNKWVESVPFIS